MKFRIPLAAVAAVFLLASCAETAVDQVGLKYNEGPVEGNSFDKIIEPGSGQVFVWNDSVKTLPINQRDYTFCDERTEKDKPVCDASSIKVTAKGGAELAFSGGITFELNTGDEEILRNFYEEVCRKFSCDDMDDGWDEMLRVNMRGPIEDSLQEEVRGFSVDALYAGTPAEGEDLGEEAALSTLTQVSDKLAESLRTTINAYAGGPYFCGPAYERSDPDACPDFEFIITEVRPTNEAVVASFDKNVASRQAVIDARNRADAERIKALGLREAQDVLRELYSDGNWLDYQRYVAMLECASNANCTLIFGAEGDTGVNVEGRTG